MTSIWAQRNIARPKTNDNFCSVISEIWLSLHPVINWKFYAIKDTFENVEVKGCHFHFSQAIKKHIKTSGFETENFVCLESSIALQTKCSNKYQFGPFYPVFLQTVASQFKFTCVPLESISALAQIIRLKRSI